MLETFDLAHNRSICALESLGNNKFSLSPNPPTRQPVLAQHFKRLLLDNTVFLRVISIKIEWSLQRGWWVGYDTWMSQAVDRDRVTH